MCLLSDYPHVHMLQYDMTLPYPLSELSNVKICPTVELGKQMKASV